MMGEARPSRLRIVWAIAAAFSVFTLIAGSTGNALAGDRVERFPAPDFRSGHVMPTLTTTQGPWAGWQEIDVVVLAVFLVVAAWLVLKKRSRRATFWMTVLAVAYFGFWKKGCICPVGSLQNVALAAGGNGYSLPWTVSLVFLLPLLFSLFVGRVFCSGVCPLGAIQDLVLYKPIHLPAWIETPLGMIAWAYLGLAVLFAATGSDFLVCRYDPFVGLFRMSGPSHMIIFGGVLLVLSMFIGRVYCRFLCPYSVLLRMLAIFSRTRVTITPKACVDCRLCEMSCPFGAIRYPSSVEGRRSPEAARRQVALAMATVPVLMIALAGLGYWARGAMARIDFTVRLAEKVYAEEHGGARAALDETRAFWATGQPAEQLYTAAAKTQARFAIGAPLFGTWMGLALGGRALSMMIRRRRTGYTADPAACVSCARCYESCPIEIEVRQMKADPSFARGHAIGANAGV